MRPFDYIPLTKKRAKQTQHDPKLDPNISRFLCLSAFYMNLPAERIKQLQQTDL